ncbi:MAG: cob(I)yrinic acid a,c-diamide adenosyltransferase [Nitrososphaeria archaeon]|nr:cob(I)yrinic acid a,c-diamide adenosyltransferase [Nitrososphaeria archaeon]
MRKYKLDRGYTHIITGDGPGKTTSAFGLAVRALGWGLKVCVIQFLKKRATGEILFFRKYHKNIMIRQFGTRTFVNKGIVTPQDIKLAVKGLDYARKIVLSGIFDLVILDEINMALYFGLLKVEDVILLIKSKPEKVELVLTGRNAPEELFDYADYLIKIDCLRHPFSRGQTARKGIEF